MDREGNKQESLIKNETEETSVHHHSNEKVQVFWTYYQTQFNANNSTKWQSK